MTGEQVKAIRVRLGMTQQTFAVALGVSISTIQKLETGTTRKASPMLTQAIKMLEISRTPQGQE